MTGLVVLKLAMFLVLVGVIWWKVRTTGGANIRVGGSVTI